MTLRRQGGAAKLLASAYHLSAFTGALGLGWRPGADGNEVDGVDRRRTWTPTPRARSR